MIYLVELYEDKCNGQLIKRFYFKTLSELQEWCDTKINFNCGFVSKKIILSRIQYTEEGK